jgi:hypothetical protein
MFWCLFQVFLLAKLLCKGAHKQKLFEMPGAFRQLSEILSLLHGTLLEVVFDAAEVDQVDKALQSIFDECGV